MVKPRGSELIKIHLIAIKVYSVWTFGALVVANTNSSVTVTVTYILHCISCDLFLYLGFQEIL